MNELGDGRTYATLVIKGEKYSLWNKEYLENLQEGDVIEYDFKQSGNYRNISGFKKVQQNQLFDPDDNGHKNGLNNGFCNGLSPGLKKDREIVRMSCIKSAIYLTRDFGGMDLDDQTDNVIDTARKLEKYVTDFEELPSADEFKIVDPGEIPIGNNSYNIGHG